jgi:hypothetical protein
MEASGTVVGVLTGDDSHGEYLKMPDPAAICKQMHGDTDAEKGDNQPDSSD